jgi:D-alanyl-D-alanine carboxypeptidase
MTNRTMRRRSTPHSAAALLLTAALAVSTGVAACSGAGTLSRVPAPSVTVAPDPARFQSRLQALRDSMDIQGVSAAVILSDGSLWNGEAGEAAPGVPVESATVFDAGSIGKMFTAAILLQLADEGALDLDSAIDRWLPAAPGADRVTPRMLLTHTSGWADIWHDPSLIPRLVSAPMRRWTPAEILDATPPPTAEPGTAWNYSSSGYVALGMIAEAAAGVSFATLLRARLLEPLGLERTVHGAFDEPAGPLAHAWLDINDDGVPEDFTALLPATSWRTAAGAAGAIITSATDLAVFTRALLTGELHGAATAARLREDWVHRPDGNRHGLGVLRMDLDGVELVGHRGNAAGYSAAAWHAPGPGITIAVLSNRHAVLVTPIVAALLDAALDAALP